MTELHQNEVHRDQESGHELWAYPQSVPSRFFGRLNPFTPESDQCQNSPAASQEIWHHTVWRTWLFIAYSDEKWLYYKFLLRHSYNRFLKGWENTLLRSAVEARPNDHLENAAASEGSFCVFLESVTYGITYEVNTWEQKYTFTPPALTRLETVFLPRSKWNQSLSDNANGVSDWWSYLKLGDHLREWCDCREIIPWSSAI